MKIYAAEKQQIINDYYDLNALSGLPQGKIFAYKTSRYKYFVAKLYLLDNFDEEITIRAGALYSGEKTLNGVVSCINTTGVTCEGFRFFSKLRMVAGRIQPIFIGIDVSDAALGDAYAYVNIGNDRIKIMLRVTDDLVFNDGVEETAGLSRLGWLNSVRGLDMPPLKKYEPLVSDADKLIFTGKEATLANDGLLESVTTHFTESLYLDDETENKLFYRPMEFTVDGQRYKFSKQRIYGKGSKIVYLADAKSDSTHIQITANVYYEGCIDYKISLVADKDIIINNISLSAYFAACKYDMGLGKVGGLFAPISYKWNRSYCQDSVFIGDINCGARVRFKDENTRQPFEGEFFKYKKYKLPQDSWDNYGRGEISVTKTDEGAALVADTGMFVLAAGKELKFCFDVYITPFKELDVKKQFSMRGYETDSKTTDDKFIKSLTKADASIAAIGLGRFGYKNLNSPLSAVWGIKKCNVAALKSKKHTLVDYSMWQLSAENRELYSFAAFGDELVYRSAHSLDAALTAQYGEGVLPTERGINGDTGVMLQADSRMINYYLEAAAYLLKETHVAGLLTDGASLNRTAMERLAQITAASKAECGVFLKEKNYFSESKAMSNTLNLHTPLMPFVDGIVVDKSFALNSDTDYILTEMSGLLYGNLAESVGSDFNPFYALLFGMKQRGGFYRERQEAVLNNIYNELDEFGIANARMYGFWDKQNPVSSDKQDIYATSYVDGGRMLVVVYNAADKAQQFDIGINPKLGFSSVGKKMYRPLIVGVHPYKKINFNKEFALKAKSGFVFIVE